MTSSSRIHGVSIRRAIQRRTRITSSATPVTTRTSGQPPSLAETSIRPRGAATGSVATRDLAHGCRKVLQLSRLYAQIRSGLGDLADERCLDGGGTRDVLAGGRVQLGDPVEVVLALRECTRRGRHLVAVAAVGGEQPQRVLERFDLAFPDRHLDRDVVGQLGEPADV